MILNKKATSFNIKGEKASDYVLKVCGQDEYLVGDYELIQYQYIQDCVAREVVPTLVTVSLCTVPSKFFFLELYMSKTCKTMFFLYLCKCTSC